LDEYEHLGFATATGWHNFLRNFLTVTQRERRDEDKHQGQEPRRYDLPGEGLSFLFESPVRNPKRGTEKNPKRGTFKGILGTFASSLKNPPDGFYRDARIEDIKKGESKSN
jgi:hypothetical protein